VVVARGSGSRIQPKPALLKEYGSFGAICRFPQRSTRLSRLDYGIAINGILGLDFLMQTEAILNLHLLELNSKNLA
jgi:hypothetical protein